MNIHYTQSYGNSELTIGNCDRIAISYKHSIGRFVIERNRITVHGNYLPHNPEVCELYNFLREKGFDRIRSQSKKIQTSGSDAGVSIIVHIKSAGFRHEVRNSEKNTLLAKDRPNFEAIDRAITSFNTRNVLAQNIVVRVIIDKSAVSHFLDRGHSMSLFIPDTVTPLVHPETKKERNLKIPKRLLFTLQPVRAIGSARSIGENRERVDSIVVEPTGEVIVKRAFLPLGTYRLQMVSYFEDDSPFDEESHCDEDDDEFNKAHAAEFSFTTPSELTVQRCESATFGTTASLVLDPLGNAESVLRVSIVDTSKQLLVSLQRL